MCAESGTLRAIGRPYEEDRQAARRERLQETFCEKTRYTDQETASVIRASRCNQSGQIQVLVELS
jgi:hypothetical protein